MPQHDSLRAALQASTDGIGALIADAEKAAEAKDFDAVGQKHAVLRATLQSHDQIVHAYADLPPAEPEPAEQVEANGESQSAEDTVARRGRPTRTSVPESE